MKIRKWTYLGWHIFLRDFRIRYRRAMFGAFWAVAPVAAFAVGISLIGDWAGLAREPSTIPYPLLVLTGLILFQIFSEAVSAPIQIVRRCRIFMRTTPFDYEGILVASLIRVAISFVFKFPLLVGACLYYEQFPDWFVFAGIVGLLALALAGMSIGAVLVPYNMMFLDIRYGLPYVQMLIMLASPILYPLPDAGLIREINLANPLTYLVLPTRSWLLGATTDFGTGFVIAVLSIVALAIFAVLHFRRGIPMALAHV